MDGLLQDLRYAFRSLRKSPTIAFVAVLTLALGIGAPTAIFTIANELLLRPRPGIGGPEALVDIGRSQNGAGFDNMSYPNFADFRARNTSFSGVLGYMLEPRAASMSVGGSAERIYISLVTGNYFSLLQVRPAAGRFFTEDEDREPGAHPVAVLSHSFWQRSFGGDANVVGREIKINGQPFVVAGVASPEFRGTTVLAPDAWFPMAMSSTFMPGTNLRSERRAVWMVAMGRLKPGVTIEQAQAEAFVIGDQLRREFPNENEGKGFALNSSRLFPGDLQNYVAAFLGVLLVVVGLILLIVCVNVAGILLARAAARQREIAVRMALGAGKGRIVRQLATEGALLFLIAGTAGLVVGVWMCALLRSLIPQLPFPVALDLKLDWRVLVFAFGLTSLAGLLSSLAPALQVADARLMTALKDESQGGSPRRLRLHNALVVGQVALSVVLLVSAGLFLRALANAKTLDPGFDATHVQMADLDFSLAGYSDASGVAAAEQLLGRVQGLPGVRSADYAWTLPLDGNGRSLGGVRVPGRELPPEQRSLEVDWNVVTPGYFETMKIPILRGRTFTDGDRQGTPEVVIINETFARRLWSSEDPVGRIIEVGDFGFRGGTPQVRTLQIVGVARNHRYRSLGDTDRLFIYVPLRQNYVSGLSLVVRTEPGRAILPALRAAVQDFNSSLPILHAQSLADYTSIGLLPQRIAGWLAGSLGSLGLLLTGLGVYGITAFAVAQRTREIGIRMALGATPAQVLRMILRGGFLRVAIGLGAGMTVAFAAAPLVSSLLLGVSPQDPIAFLGVAVLMAGVALLACWIPARRAARVEPIIALRHE